MTIALQAVVLPRMIGTARALLCRGTAGKRDDRRARDEHGDSEPADLMCEHAADHSKMV
jgi:hypothetical protein